MRSNAVLTRLLLVAVAVIATYAAISRFGIGFSAPETEIEAQGEFDAYKAHASEQFSAFSVEQPIA